MLLVIYKYLSIQKYNSCIVIRVNKPTIKQIERYINWRKSFPNYYHFYILSMQVGYNFTKTNSKMKEIVVTFKEVLNKYSKIKTLKGNCSKFKSPKLLSWISHSESLIVFKNKLSFNYDYIWIIEQDVGFVGNLYNFISKYNKNERDLITTGNKTVNEEWVWLSCATKKYLSRRLNFFHSNLGYFNREYIQRWSNKYFSYMMRDLDNEYHSQSETSTIEIIYYYNLTFEIIPKSNIGSPMCAGESITEIKWFNITNNIYNINKFFHPLKF